MGWGSQNDANHSQPSTQPMMLVAETVLCPPEFSISVETPRTSYPMFFCVSAPNLGGPCEGDDGGKHELILIVY